MPEPARCLHCDGQGQVEACHTRVENGVVVGRQGFDVCRWCSGTGWVEERKESE